MKTMITRNNVPRHNGTMTCLLGRSRPWEFRVITPRHGLLLRGLEQKHAEAAEDAEANREPVEASGSHGSRQEVVEDMWETRKGSEGVREVWERCGRSGRGPEGHEKVQKRRKGTGSNSTLQV